VQSSTKGSTALQIARPCLVFYFINRSFDKISGFIQRAQSNSDVRLLVGGTCNNSTGYFISPTILETKNPKVETMVDEIFGPVLSVRVAPSKRKHNPALL
jgi:acyl-CoA reductase-like NAD-dependent aldehyde dehydrogenase